MGFCLADGTNIPAVTAEQMRAVDRLAVEELHLQMLQMMENAGRSLCELVLEELGTAGGSVVLLAGGGGNGGGGLCCARHLHNRGVPVRLVLDRPSRQLRGPASRQMRTLEAAGLRAAKSSEAAAIIANAAVVVDALVGYGLRGAARGMAAELIGLCNRSSARIISLDVPSGLDATTGDSAGPVVQAQIVLTLALPKTGLERLDARIYLADIGIAPALFGALGLKIGPMFRSGYRLTLHRS